jgi:hypothetical protein
MFQSATKEIRESVYGILCHSNLGDQEIADHGSGFMIAPGIIATVAHVLHKRGDRNSPLHDIIDVIRSPDIELNMENAYPLAVDSVRDFVNQGGKPSKLKIRETREKNSKQRD